MNDQETNQQTSSSGQVPVTTELPPILLIDDDPNVLETLKDICESLNCGRLVTCLDPQAAFDEAADPSLGLIVCDYRFPNASGVKFIGEVRQRGIETPVLFISGTPDTDAVLVASQIRNTAFLGKPFTIQRFRDAIMRLLGRGS
ncbi:MAG: response regulator [Terrimicrobiaceae bacterium]